MQKVSMAILHCAEYNFEKLKKRWGKPESPEQALRWRLEGGIAKCVGLLLISETYHWNKLKIGRRRYHWNRGEKKPPKNLRRILFKLVNNPGPVQVENERIAELRTGIWDAVMYLRNIKEDKNYLNSTVLQNVHEYLESLLELEMPQITEITNPEDCL